MISQPAPPNTPRADRRQQQQGELPVEADDLATRLAGSGGASLSPRDGVGHGVNLSAITARATARAAAVGVV